MSAAIALAEHTAAASVIRNILIAMGFSMAASLPVGAAPQSQPMNSTESQIQRFLEEQTSRINGRIEIEVGEVDPRLTLAPCARTEPYLPASARLWGRSQIGLRCISGASWNVSIPVYVRVFATALVSNRSLQAGQPLQREDFSEQEQELTKEAGRAVVDLAALENKTLNRSITSGAIVREEWLRSIPVIQSGDQVRVLAIGAGFSISTEGAALTTAAEGQQVKVRSESGRVVTGIARIGRIAEVRL